MPHDKSLIEEIQKKLEKHYPPDNHVFLIEQQFLTGTRVFPDIQVIDAKKKIKCVVEIGYTRPEKLSFYIKSGVIDVRWYSKNGELHTPIKECIVNRIEYVADSKQFFYRVDIDINKNNTTRTDEIFWLTECPCIEESIKEEEIEGSIKEEEIEDIITNIQSQGYIEYWSNGIRSLLILMCNECGRTTFDLHPEILEFDVLMSESSKSQRHNKKMANYFNLDLPAEDFEYVLTFEKVKSRLKERYDYELFYDELAERLP